MDFETLKIEFGIRWDLWSQFSEIISSLILLRVKIVYVK